MNKKLIAFTFFSLVLVASQASNAFACSKADADKATARAHVLAKRNTFLNTKFPKSESAPAFHLEKARAIRAAKKE